MTRKEYSVVRLARAMVVPLCALVIAGCSKTEETTLDTSTADTAMPDSRGRGGSGNSGGQRDRPGGRMGGHGEGRFQPVAANATAPEIFQQKCQNCHGDQGQGARGPALVKAALKDSAELRQTIHDGRDKMPAFGKQMTAAQLNAMVAYVKQLGAKG